MPWTYANAPGTASAAERRDAVRLAVGDTDAALYASNPELTVSDEEIAYWLSASSNGILAASIEAAKALYARWSRLPDTQVVGVGSVKAGDVAGRLRQVQLDLQSDAANRTGPRFGGQSKAEIARLAALTDVPQPTWTRGGDSHPGVGDSL